MTLPPRLRSLIVPGIPFAVSLLLSFCTVGSRVDWQDSGFYITAVKEFGVLYPPGFVLYLVLCKLWTTLLFFVDFIVAVHLFSSFCVALAAGTLALAARDLLRSRGAIFRCSEADPGPLADGVAVLVGCLAAAGYTFWYAGILAKGYSLYYLVLSLLLWRMIRADESLKRSDFTIVAVLIGLAWQAHPSSALVGLPLVLFVFAHRKTLGGKGIAGRAGLAALCALGPALLLPMMAGRETLTEFDGPATVEDLVRYLHGARFTEMPGAFGFDASRFRSLSQYLWEEFLGVGLILCTSGLATLSTNHRKLLLGLLAWVLPVTLLTGLFKIEGQHDLWMVAAWLPLWLAAAVGAFRIARAAGRRAPAILAGLAAAGLAWGVALNLPLVSRHGYEYPEILGRMFLEKLEKDSTLVLISDDATAICRCLQAVRGLRPDVLIIREEDLAIDERGGPRAPYRRLLKRRPGLQPLDLPTVRAGVARAVPARDTLLTAFLNANASAAPPIYLERRPQAVDLLRRDFSLTPAGALTKWEPHPGKAPDPRHWDFPIQAEQVRAAYRRARGQEVESRGGAITVRPQAYEERLLQALLRARQNLATLLLAGSGQAGWRRSAELCESILELRPGAEKDGRVLYMLGMSYAKLGETARAEAPLSAAAVLEIPARARAEAAVWLGRICLEQKRPADARRWFDLARSQAEISAETLRDLDLYDRR